MHKFPAQGIEKCTFVPGSTTTDWIWPSGRSSLGLKSTSMSNHNSYMFYMCLRTSWQSLNAIVRFVFERWTSPSSPVALPLFRLYARQLHQENEEENDWKFQKDVRRYPFQKRTWTVHEIINEGGCDPPPSPTHPWPLQWFRRTQNQE